MRFAIPQDLRGSIVKLARHVGKELSDDVIDTILKRVTFTGMTNTYQKLNDDLGEEGKEMTHALGVTPYLRKGNLGRTFSILNKTLVLSPFPFLSLASARTP